MGVLRAAVQVPELVSILEALEARGVVAITHKGPALSALAYGRTGSSRLGRPGPGGAGPRLHGRRAGAARARLPAQQPRGPAPAPGGRLAEGLERNRVRERRRVDLRRSSLARLPGAVPLPRRSGPAVVPTGSSGAGGPRGAGLSGRGAARAPVPARRQGHLAQADLALRRRPAGPGVPLARLGGGPRLRGREPLSPRGRARLSFSRTACSRRPCPRRSWRRLAEDETLVRLLARVEDELATGGIRRPWWLDRFGVLPFHLEVFDAWRDGVGLPRSGSGDPAGLGSGSCSRSGCPTLCTGSTTFYGLCGCSRRCPGMPSGAVVGPTAVSRAG